MPPWAGTGRGRPQPQCIAHGFQEVCSEARARRVSLCRPADQGRAVCGRSRDDAQPRVDRVHRSEDVRSGRRGVWVQCLIPARTGLVAASPRSLNQAGCPPIPNRRISRWRSVSAPPESSEPCSALAPPSGPPTPSSSTSVRPLNDRYCTPAPLCLVCCWYLTAFRRILGLGVAAKPLDAPGPVCAMHSEPAWCRRGMARGGRVPPGSRPPGPAGRSRARRRVAETGTSSGEAKPARFARDDHAAAPFATRGRPLRPPRHGPHGGGAGTRHAWVKIPIRVPNSAPGLLI